jgi:hypothetical protein
MRRWLDPASVTDITVGVMHCRAGSSALERADIMTGKAQHHGEISFHYSVRSAGVSGFGAAGA